MPNRLWLSRRQFIRPCRRGHKVGPAFADDRVWGERLLESLLSLRTGEFVQLDVPEPNQAAVAFAERLGWTQAFGCARMVEGATSPLTVARTFGVTSFEFG